MCAWTTWDCHLLKGDKIYNSLFPPENTEAFEPKNGLVEEPLTFLLAPPKTDGVSPKKLEAVFVLLTSPFKFLKPPQGLLLPKGLVELVFDFFLFFFACLFLFTLLFPAAPPKVVPEKVSGPD